MTLSPTSSSRSVTVTNVEVSDGVTTVNPTDEIVFTSGATVTNAGAGAAHVAGFNGGTITTPLDITIPTAVGPSFPLAISKADLPNALFEVELNVNDGNAGVQVFSDLAAGVASIKLADRGTADGLAVLSTIGLYVQPQSAQLDANEAIELTDKNGNDVFVITAAGHVGFFNQAPAAKPTVTGAKLPSDTVMASLLSALAALGLVTDSTT